MMTSSGRIAFTLIKRRKSKGYIDGKAFMVRERLKNKFELISAWSLVKMKKQPIIVVLRRP
jgi:hypothetical protein